MAHDDHVRGEILRTFDLTPAESALLSAVHYGITVEPDSLPRHASGESYSLTRPVTAEECRDALGECLHKGRLRVIDQAALDELAADIERRGLFGPIYRYPPLGGVDFTREGADLWLQLSQRLRSGRPDFGFAYTDTVHTKSAWYFRSQAAAKNELTRQRDDWPYLEATSAPTPIGRWCVQWWREYAEDAARS